MQILPYQAEFIEFLSSSGALSFGDFVTKSGRKTPYFLNTGRFNSGESITRLGRFYAAHIAANNLAESDIIFGPAYKGIPLCVATATALYLHHSKNVGFSFNRKEEKDHGDGGTLVGAAIQPKARVVIVEDVITAGTTLKQTVPMLRSLQDVEITGVVIAVDRAERGSTALSAVQEVRDTLGIKVYPIITVHHILEYFSSKPENHTVTPELLDKIRAYLKEYGV